MNTPFDFTSLFQDPSAQRYLSGIRGLYQAPEQDYFDPADPRYQEYVDLASQAPPSENILGSFMNKMPRREEFQPSTGRKIGGFLLGMLGGMNNPNAAYQNTRSFIERPYTEALSDWSNESKFIDDQARLADSARNRQLGTLKFGLEQSSRAKRYKSLDEKAAQALAERTAKGAETFTGKSTDRDERAVQNDIMNTMRQLALQMGETRLGLERERVDLTRERDEFNRNKPPKVTPADKEKELKGTLQTTASGLNIPYRASTPAPEIAKAIAWKELLEDQTLKQYVTFDEEAGGFAVKPGWEEIVKKRVQARMKSLLAGLD
jgi:hypothetical protein